MADDGGPVLGKGDLVVRRVRADRLKSGRPDRPGRDVAQVAEAAEKNIDDLVKKSSGGKK